MVFRDFSRIWARPGHFTSALAKGTKTTTWIWNLHAEAHDFDGHRTSGIINTKVFSSRNAHIALVFLWLGGMHFHGAYLSNYNTWLMNPKHCLPSAHSVWSLIGQDILNSDLGKYFHGEYITSGLFNIWRAEGLISVLSLKYGASVSVLSTLSALLGSYFHMHIVYASAHFDRKFKSLATHHCVILLGLGSISWSGHFIHIALPINKCLDSGITPLIIPWPEDLLFRGAQQIIFPEFGTLSIVDFSIFLLKGISITGSLLNPATGSIFLGLIGVHHFLYWIGLFPPIMYLPIGPSNHLELSTSLLFSGTLSMVFGHHVYAMPIYPYLASDYGTVFSLFCHHINMASFNNNRWWCSHIGLYNT